MNRKNSKVLVVLVLALVFLLSCVSVYAADSKVYDYAKAYDTTQGPDWFYQYNDGSGYKDIKYYKEDWMTWISAQDCKGTDGKESYCNVYSDSASDSAKLHPDILNGKNTEAVITWKAPSDGKAVIAKASVAQNPYGSPSDGVDFSIVFGTKTLFSAYVGNSQTVEQPEITVDVKAGDKIHFAAGIHENNGNDEVGWPLLITFTPAEGAAVSDTATAENPKTGDMNLLPYIALAVISLFLLGTLALKGRRPVKS